MSARAAERGANEAISATVETRARLQVIAASLLLFGAARRAASTVFPVVETPKLAERFPRTRSKRIESRRSASGRQDCKMFNQRANSVQANPNKTKQNCLDLFGFIRPNRDFSMGYARKNKKNRLASQVVCNALPLFSATGDGGFLPDEKV
jgi:hypothetical protein